MLLGVIIMPFTVTLVVAVKPEPASAVTVAVPGENPAVNKPLESMDPSPVTDHVTGRLAVSCSGWPTVTVGSCGVTLRTATVTKAVAVAPEPSVALAVTVPVPGEVAV